jgi:transposase
LTVSDTEMCGILNELGFSVNVKYVERFRKKLGIQARGTCPRKITENQLQDIMGLIREYTRERKDAWQLSVSDAEMSRILNEKGYPVNVKYVERIRRSLGIEPLDNRGGARLGAGRPADCNYAQDLIFLHDLAVKQLSYRRPPSGSLRGQSGADVHDRFGYHATDLEDAVQRKAAMLTRARNQKDKSIGLSGRSSSVVQDIVDGADEIAAVYTVEIEAKTNIYGRTGKGGVLQNTKTAQAFSSM